MDNANTSRWRIEHSLTFAISLSGFLAGPSPLRWRRGFLFTKVQERVTLPAIRRNYYFNLISRRSADSSYVLKADRQLGLRETKEAQ